MVLSTFSSCSINIDVVVQLILMWLFCSYLCSCAMNIDVVALRVFVWLFCEYFCGCSSRFMRWFYQYLRGCSMDIYVVALWTRLCYQCLCGSIHIHMVALSIFMLQMYFFLFLTWSSSGHTGSLTTKEQQRKTGLWHIRILCHSCQPCSWCHWYWLSNTKWQPSWTHFHDFQTSNFNKPGNQLTAKLL